MARRAPTARGSVLRAAGARHDAECHLGQREARVFGGVDEVAAQRDLHAAGIGGAVHRGDDRHRAGDDGANGALEDQVLVLPLLIRHAVALFQVAAGAERARAGAGEHDAALLVGRAADGVEQVEQIEAHLRVHRIGDLGTVQRDQQRVRLWASCLQRLVGCGHGVRPGR